MLKSMTAFGRAAYVCSLGRFNLEIQSVNRKFLEINVSMPRELLRYELEIKRGLAPLISRGQVSVKLKADFDGHSPLVIKPNICLAKQFKHAWDRLASELGVEETNGFRLDMLAGFEGIFQTEEEVRDEAIIEKMVQEILALAVENLMKMKREEGAILQRDISERIVKIESLIHHISNLCDGASARLKERLKARLEEVLPGSVDNEERVLREIVLFADKIDIAEELTRFNCHIKHFKELLESHSTQIGKTLEFILQELGREINTIGSKSADIEIARRVIEIKSELERIREQIQNVE